MIATPLIKTEYVGGPKDGDRRAAISPSEFYYSADADYAHHYALAGMMVAGSPRDVMVYRGEVELTQLAPTIELRPLTVGEER